MPMPESAAPRQALQERVAATILEAARRVFGARGERASMSDVAAAAGVTRGTVYRYFPNRQSLLDELAGSALRAAGDRLAAARIDEVPVFESITRAVRALVEVGELFALLARERVHGEGDDFERYVGGPLRALVERGQSTGELRGDMPSAWLTDSLIGIVANILSSEDQRGVDDTVAAITGVYIDGARHAGAAA
jgi:TetR/AcrR family transcriptional regulator, mexCD-oprJ operon repressor